MVFIIKVVFVEADVVIGVVMVVVVVVVVVWANRVNSIE